MSVTERHIVNSYSGLFSGPSSVGKLELIESLSKLSKDEKKDIDKKFHNSFGAFASEKSAEEIIADIEANRKFKSKSIEF